MKIFIDSADLTEIQQAYQWGIVDGITTNPSLIKKAVDRWKNVNIRAYISEILTTAKGTPVSLEVTETSALGMIEQGKRLFALFNHIAKNVVIKIPINPAFKESDANQMDGIQAIQALKKIGIPVNCTLIFTPEQALLAAKAGAAFVSPFAGRVDDFIREKNNIKFGKEDYFPLEGMANSRKEAKKMSGAEDSTLEDNGVVSGIDLIEQCVQILRQYQFPTEVLAASLRNPRQVREAALIGADIATLPFSVIQKMAQHEKTYEGMKHFTQDIVPEYAKLGR